MTLYAATITLFLILDPIGNIPAFLGLLHSVSPTRRKWIIAREMFIALLILLLFLFFGKYILDGMQISGPALSISGSIILFLTAIKMIFPSRKERENSTDDSEPFLVPLAVPLVAGPSAIAIVMLFSSTYPNQIVQWFFGILFAWLIASAILIASDGLHRILGNQLLEGIERLMGLILTTLAVQMFLVGIKAFFIVL